jgi:hypothetical protein
MAAGRLLTVSLKKVGVGYERRRDFWLMQFYPS